MGWGPEDQELEDTIDRAIKNATEKLSLELSAMTQRAEAAEARIKASQEQQYGFVPEFVKFKQEPCGCRYAEYELQLTDCGGEFEGDAPKLYTAPVIPPDVVELQSENANLTRKLAEQTAFADKYAREVLELTKLLAEAKSKAVPEGWKRVPIVPTENMQMSAANLVRKMYPESPTFRQLYVGMLAAAPQPETAKCESCGGNDEDAPCAYPSERKHGCLRDARMSQPETDRGSNETGKNNK